MIRNTARSLAALAAIGLVGWLVAGQVEIRSDLSFAFPEEVSERTRFLTDRLADPAAQGTYLIAVEGADAPGRARVSMQLTQALNDSGSFGKVANGAGAGLPDGFDYLFENRYLIGPSWNKDEEFSVAAITDSLKRNMAFLATSPGHMLRRYLPADPVGRGQQMLAALAPASPPATRNGVWTSQDGARALILASAKTESFDLDRQAALLTEIRERFNGLRGGGNFRLLIAGPPGFAVAIRDRIQGNVRILSAVAFLLILLLAWGGFRRPTLLLLLGLPLGIGVLAGLAAVQAAFGFVHGITLAFGASLVGIAIDYPLHVLAHAAGHGDTRCSARTIWPTLRLSAATSIAAFVPFMLADFPGLAQVGLFVGAGLVAALLSGRFLFPLLCPSVDRFPLSDALVARLRHAAAMLRWPLILTLAGSALVIGLKWQTLWETDLNALSPAPPELISLDRELRTGLGAPDVRYLVAVRGATADEVLRRQEALRPVLRDLQEEEAIGGWRMAADLLPSEAEQRRRQAALPKPHELRRRLADAVAGTTFRSNVFEPFVAAVAAMRAADPVDFDRLAASGAGDLVTAQLGATHGEYTGIVTLSGISDADRIAGTIADAAIDGVDFVDLKRETDLLVQSFLDSSLLWLAASLVAVLLFLYAGLRRATTVARVMGPVVISIAATLGLLAALDIPISLFHILSLILVAGLGMDYGLFFARHGSEATVTLRAILLCNLTTASVFFVMAFSSIPVLHGIGLTVAAGSFLALVGSVAFASLTE